MGDRFQLAISYFESVMGKSIQQVPPVPVSGMGMVEIIWPLNEMFQPFITRIRTIKYDSKYEAAADKAIELYVRNPGISVWDSLPGDVWRVLLERHNQLIATGMANEVAGNKNFTALPLGLPESARLGGIMLLWLHSMPLPFPPEDRSDFELPAGSQPASMTLH